MTQELVTLTPGTIVHGRYRIEKLFGQGGMGAVYKATDQRLSNFVALKQTLVSNKELDRAFEREAKLLASLHHPALPRVSDYFADELGRFLVMDFVAGDDLGELLNKQEGQPFDAKTVIHWAQRVLDALEYLHAQSPPIVHRDIKPENMKLTPEGNIILLDFGLAKGKAIMQTMMSGTKSLFGYTPQYAPPEQINGSGTDARSDIYALSVTLYYLLTGSHPANASSRTNSLVIQKKDPLQPAHLVHRQVPPALSTVLAKGMELNPDKRYQTATEMRRALAKVDTTSTRSTPAMPVWVWAIVGVGGVLVLLLVVIALTFGGSDSPSVAEQNPTAAPAAVGVPGDEEEPTPTRTPIPTIAEDEQATPSERPITSSAPTSTPAQIVRDASIAGVTPENAYIGNLDEQPLELVLQGQNLAQFADGEALISREDDQGGISASRAEIVSAEGSELMLAFNNVPQLPSGVGQGLYTLDLESPDGDSDLSFEVTLRDFLRAATVEGVRSQYDYTGRIVTDEDVPFTRMRLQPDINSDRGAFLRNGDELEILNEDTPEWYQARIRSSHDPTQETQIWWIERWLVDNESVPPPAPTSVPVPPTAEPPAPQPAPVEPPAPQPAPVEPPAPQPAPVVPPAPPGGPIVPDF